MIGDLSRRPLLAVWLAALLARAVMLLLVDPLADLASGDAAYFLAVARSIADGAGHSLGGVPTAYQAPGYPLFLAVVPAPLIAQSLLTTAVGLLVARRLNLLAALLYVTCPFLIVYEWRLLGEALAINLMVAAFLLVAFPRARWEPLAGGVLMGLAILTRDTLLYLPLFLLVAALFHRPALKRIAIVTLIAWLTVLPWQIRNGGPISEGRLGLNLWIGTWERTPDWIDLGFAKARWPENAFRNNAEKQRLQISIARKEDHVLFDAAVGRILSDPIGVATNWVVRYPRLWLGTRTEQIQLRPERGTALWTAAKGGFYLLNLATVIAGLVGMFLALRADRRWIFAAVPIAYIALIYIPFHNTEPRYSLPALPFLLAFAAYAASALMVRSARGSEALPASN